MSDVHIEATGKAPAQRAGSQSVWKVLTVLLAVACAVLAFLLLRPAAEAEGGPTASAESSAQLACDVLAEISPMPESEADSDEAWVMVNETNLVRMAAMTAEAQDSSYVEFRKTLEAPAHAHARTFSMDSPEFHEALEAAQAACADEFPDEG